MTTRVTLQEIANVLSHAHKSGEFEEGEQSKLGRVNSFKSEEDNADEELLSRKRMWKR